MTLINDKVKEDFLDTYVNTLEDFFKFEDIKIKNAFISKRFIIKKD